MNFEESDGASRTGSLLDEDPESQNAFLPFIQMDELFDKLKLLNYEKDFVERCRVRPLNRHYFALQTNPGEQFFVFSSLAAWLIRKRGLNMDPPQEYDDPNTTIAFILDLARKLEIRIDFPPNKLRQGYGRFVIKLLDSLCDEVLKSSNFTFKKPVTPVEASDEELIVEDDAELLLERIEEEMAAEDPDSEEDEDVFLHVDDLNKLNYTRKIDDVLQTNITNEEWQLEIERVLPSLKLTIRTGKLRFAHRRNLLEFIELLSNNKDWRSHIESIKTYRATIGDSMQSVKSLLDRLTSNISDTMTKITNREKFLNSNLEPLLTEYRSIHEQYSKVNSRYRELNSGVIDRQRKLTKITEALESMKQEMEERGTIMSDGTPLINIKKALVALREDVVNTNIQIAILQHDILHSKLREKLLMQQKLQSQVYA